MKKWEIYKKNREKWAWRVVDKRSGRVIMASSKEFSTERECFSSAVKNGYLSDEDKDNKNLS